MKTLIYLSFTLIILVSCDKIIDKEITVSGIALSAVDQTPLANQTVILKELKSTYPGVDVIVLDEAITDNYGKFSFDFPIKKRNKYSYEIELIYDDKQFVENWYATGGQSRILLNKDNQNELELSLVPIATLIYKLKNQHQSKQIVFYIENEGDSDLIFGGENRFFTDTFLLSNPIRSGQILLRQEVTDSADNLIITKYVFDLEHKEVKELTVVY